MEVLVEIKSDEEFVKRGMLSTMGVNPLINKEEFERQMKKDLSVKTFQSLMLGRHSPIEEYEVWIDSVVPERVHTHVVRHKELGKYVHSSRPDISYAKPIKDGQRSLSLRINLKRLIEIFWVRKCDRSWIETSCLFRMIKSSLNEINPVITPFLQPSCVWFGMCVEPDLKENICYIYKSKSASEARKELLKISRGEVEC